MASNSHQYFLQKMLDTMVLLTQVGRWDCWDLPPKQVVGTLIPNFRCMLTMWYVVKRLPTGWYHALGWPVTISSHYHLTTCSAATPSAADGDWPHVCMIA